VEVSQRVAAEGDALSDAFAARLKLLAKWLIGLGAPIFLMFSREERVLQLWLDSEPITFMSVREENNAVGLERRAYIGVTDFFA
jgi:hypothetical protein